MDNAVNTQPPAAGRKGPVTQLVERVYELEVIAQTLKNDYLRALADFDNFRKRMEREIESRKREGIEALICDLLPVLDNFERALCAGGDNANGIKKGVELIYRQLLNVLEGYGLKGFSCVGEEFDPRRAEAVDYVECPATEQDNRVVEELCRGYEVNGRVIRPARVKVGKSGVQTKGRPDPEEIGDKKYESNN
ncbi:MAG: nucleotide exchange factor GrpE [candidate division WOR-3 bacterium]|jgi:molecular chaperone GrpE